MVAMLAVDDETLLLLLLGFSSIFYFSLQQHHHHHHRQFIMYKWLKLEHGETSQLSFWLIYILDRDTHTHTLPEIEISTIRFNDTQLIFPVETRQAKVSRELQERGGTCQLFWAYILPQFQKQIYTPGIVFFFFLIHFKQLFL